MYWIQNSKQRKESGMVNLPISFLGYDYSSPSKPHPANVHMFPSPSSQQSEIGSYPLSSLLKQFSIKNAQNKIL